jgi:hypothetical protein
MNGARSEHAWHVGQRHFYEIYLIFCHALVFHQPVNDESLMSIWKQSQTFSLANRADFGLAVFRRPSPLSHRGGPGKMQTVSTPGASKIHVFKEPKRLLPLLCPIHRLRLAQ